MLLLSSVFCGVRVATLYSCLWGSCCYSPANLSDLTLHEFTQPDHEFKRPEITQIYAVNNIKVHVVTHVKVKYRPIVALSDDIVSV